MHNNRYLVVPIVLVTASLLSGTLLMSNKTSADSDSVVDNISISIPVSCTLSGTGMNSHNATIPNGTYQADIGTTTLKAFCNDSNGFAIYAAGYTGNEIEGTNSNKLVGTSASSNAVIDTGLATSTGSPDVSNWAMKLATSSGATYALTLDNGYGAYSLVPSAYTKVAHRDSGTDIGTSATGAELTTTYAAYISKTQPADSYTGQVIYTLVHPAGEVPNTDISIEDAYAKNGKQKYNGYYKMQEMSDSICSIVTLYDEASQTQLIDIRDNKTYYVAKLQDGNCWMTQNLDHDIVTTPNYYTNENTDIGYNSSTQSYDTTSWTATYATHTPSDTYWCDEYNTYNNGYSSCPYTTIASYNPGELYWDGTVAYYGSESTCTAAGGTWDSLNHSCSFFSSTGNPHYHLGNYYNWNAAVATNDSSSIAEGTLVDRSICPTGWTLPRPGTGANSFYNLLDNYGFTDSPTLNNQNIWDSPLYFGLHGTTSNSAKTNLYGVGFTGAYWTSYLAFNDTSAYAPTLGVGEERVDPGDWDSVDGGSTYLGQSVRCLSRPVTNTIEGL